MYMNTASRPERVGQIGAILLAGAVICAILGVLHETAQEIVHTWYSSNAFNHGFLIIPICAYLAWRRREELTLAERAPSVLGFVAVAAFMAVWLVGHLTGTLIIQEFALVALIQSAVLALFGRAVVRVLAFPLFYLFFAVPFGEAFVPPLQDVTAKIAVLLVQAVGIPVFRDGNFISVPTGNFVVAEACAGVRYLIASLALGALFAGITYRSWWRRGLFMAISVVVPIVANGMRAFGIIALAYSVSSEFAKGVDHIIYGWIFFTLVTFAVLAIGMAFREEEPAGHPLKVASSSADGRLGGVAFAAVIVLAMITGAKLYGDAVDRRPVEGIAHLAPPVLENGWRLVDARDPAPPKFAMPDASLDASYESGSGRVYLHIGYYFRDRRGAQVASSDHDLSTGKHAVLAAAGTARTAIGSRTMEVQTVRTVTGGGGRVIWSWYWVDGRFVGNPYVAKLLDAKVKLLGGDPAAAIIAVAANYADQAGTADAALTRFVKGLGDLRLVLARASQ